MKEQYEQIAIQYHSEVLEKETEEILWGIVVDADKNLFQIDNIPFYGPELSCEDIVQARYDEKAKRYQLSRVETPSGNTTVQVMVLKETYNREDLYNEILYAQTEIELVDEYYFVINVPAKTDYKNVYAILAALEEEQVISFAEPNLSPKHNADIRK
ncbi:MULTISPECIES: DUF4265 domain-containing protein [unclassified Myroides]|uniref:DUF4265 domain-containing protein n=1 Tax=unclassified Myroides TaxID=2642485 RepID=UPI003D2F8EA5